MRFKRSFCTNTRLMGMMMLAIEWEEQGKLVSHVFMLDSEGLGISDFYELRGCSIEEREVFYKQKYGGLGGILITLTEEEAVFLVKKYIDKNRRYAKELPEEFYCIKMYEEGNAGTITNRHMMDVLCKKIESEKEFVNYMVLRFVARDREGLMYFSDNEVLSNLHVTEINGALLYNKMEKKGRNRYLCTCVFEDKDGYYEADLVVHIDKVETEIKDNIHDTVNTDYSLRSIMILEKRAIYDFEVFDIISKKEFLEIYMVEDNLVEEKVLSLSNSIQEIEGDEGKIFIQYYSDNSHLDEEEYLINNDVMFLAYLNSENLFIATYNQNIKDILDKEVLKVMGDSARLDDSLEFEQNVLYDFIESGNDDFYDFLDN